MYLNHSCNTQRILADVAFATLAAGSARSSVLDFVWQIQVHGDCGKQRIKNV